MRERLSKRGVGGNLLFSLLLSLGLVVAAFSFHDDLTALLSRSIYANCGILTLFLAGAGYALVAMVRLRREFQVLEDARRLTAKEDSGLKHGELTELPPSRVRDCLAVRVSGRGRGTTEEFEPSPDPIQAGLNRHAAVFRTLIRILLLVGLATVFVSLLWHAGPILAAAGTAEELEGSLGGLGPDVERALLSLQTSLGTIVLALGAGLALGFLALQLVSAQTRLLSQLRLLESACYPAPAPGGGEPSVSRMAGAGEAREATTADLGAAQRWIANALERLQTVARAKTTQADLQQTADALKNQVQAVGTGVTHLSESQNALRDTVSRFSDSQPAQPADPDQVLAQLRNVNETLTELLQAQQAAQDVGSAFFENLLRALRRKKDPVLEKPAYEQTLEEHRIKEDRMEEQPAERDQMEIGLTEEPGTEKAPDEEPTETAPPAEEGREEPAEKEHVMVLQFFDVLSGFRVRPLAPDVDPRWRAPWADPFTRDLQRSQAGVPCSELSAQAAETP